VISTLRDLIDTGDFVGGVTLGLGGAPAAVLEATERGGTFDDAVVACTAGAGPAALDGTASARAAAIVARTLGYDLRLEAVAVSPFRDVTEGPAPGAREPGGPSRRRYLAVVEGLRTRVATLRVPAASALGMASAEHQIACFETGRFAPPAALVLRGPCASVERVTAALLRDLLTLAREGDRPWRAERRARVKGPRAARA
jgi:homoserine dehydrogenase